MKNKMGYCNCKSDVWQRNRKTPYLIKPGEKYHQVRVDSNGLCFLCANTALVAQPYVVDNHRTIEAFRDADVTVGLTNPDGIFGER